MVNKYTDGSADRKCHVCGHEGNTGHDLGWSEELSAWVHEECKNLANLTLKEAKQLARTLYLLATMDNVPQWIRNGAEGMAIDAGKKALRRQEKRKAAKQS